MARPLTRRTWTVSRNKFPSKSNVQVIMLNATSDEAMAVVRVIMAEHPDWSVSASDTDFVEVSVKNPDDPYAGPIFEGSILDMGEALVAGTYFATALNDDNAWTNEYEIEPDGSVWHRMR